MTAARQKTLRVLAVTLTLLGLGCTVETGREPLRLPLHASGRDGGEFDVGDVAISLTRADLALGPLYLCAAENPSPDRCEDALAEFRQAVIVDALSPEIVMAGEMRAATGRVRGAIVDFGLPWPATTAAPIVADGNTLGHSLVIEGQATRGVETVRFRASIDAAAPGALLAALHGVETDHELSPDSVLDVRVDVALYFESVDWDALFLAAPIDDSVLELSPDDQAHRAIAQRMTAGPAPEFLWNGSTP